MTQYIESMAGEGLRLLGHSGIYTRELLTIIIYSNQDKLYNYNYIAIDFMFLCMCTYICVLIVMRMQLRCVCTAM